MQLLDSQICILVQYAILKFQCRHIIINNLYRQIFQYIYQKFFYIYFSSILIQFFSKQVLPVHHFLRFYLIQHNQNTPLFLIPYNIAQKFCILILIKKNSVQQYNNVLPLLIQELNSKIGNQIDLINDLIPLQTVSLDL